MYQIGGPQPPFLLEKRAYMASISIHLDTLALSF